MSDSIKGIGARVLLTSVSLSVGFMVVAVSLQQLHQDTFAQSWSVARLENTVFDVRRDLIEELPASEFKPGNVLYPMKTVVDRGWMLLGSDEETLRRKLWLSHQRLRMGYELIAAGSQNEGVEALMKAERYLHDAVMESVSMDVRSDSWKDELAWSIERHGEVLAEVEEKIQEGLRPRITELRNIPKQCGDEVLF